MTITATFSNGHVDTYKGDRNVKAAWMIVTPEGKIVSGHSLDRAKAEKTARQNAGLISGHTFNLLPRGSVPVHTLIWARKTARELGFDTVDAYETDRLAKKNAFVAACKIEVIDL